ncbi:hypothetical protein ACH5RR_009682 [Cinchona calisaya]|uniref:RING-type E3 ubiquitin transferase n=1 Tax=Cinchona calisaya TaxID=153742 RepID=A0ABD3AEV0_9GENT
MLAFTFSGIFIKIFAYLCNRINSQRQVVAAGAAQPTTTGGGGFREIVVQTSPSREVELVVEETRIDFEGIKERKGGLSNCTICICEIEDEQLCWEFVALVCCSIPWWVPFLISRLRPVTAGNYETATQSAQDMVVITIFEGEKEAQIDNINSKIDVPKSSEHINSVNGSDHDDECAICLSGSRAESPFLWEVLPQCNHGFHADCILIWLEINKTCPLCRKIFPVA